MTDHPGIRLTTDELDDLCYRHCELGESLTEEEIDRLFDTASVAIDLAHREALRLEGEPRD